MADCIWSKITDNIVTTAATVTTANGYNTNVAFAEIERISDRTNGQFPRVEVAGPNISYSEEGDTTQKMRCKLEYSLLYYEQLNDEILTTDPAAKQTRNAAADFVKALMTDFTRGGYAVMTTVTDCYPTVDFIGETPVFLWVISFYVDCFVDYKNPYSN